MRQGKHFQEQIEQLATEIEFALQWQGPALLLALYRSSHVRDDAEMSLSARLLPLELELVQVRVRSGRFNIDTLLAKVDQRNKVFSIADLDQGGGEDGADAYRVLNLQREYFIEENIRCVFWLTEKEAQRLSIYAPDFWAFRHRVIDLVAERATPERSALFCGLTWIDWPWSVFDRDVNTALDYRRQILLDLPDGPEAAAMRCNLYGEIAGLYIQNQNWRQALAALNLGLVHVAGLDDVVLHSEFLIGQAIVFLQTEDYEQAQLVLEKALTLTPKSENVLTLLAQA
ncbi:MAG: hypothetical protein L3J16_02305, partial [Anaerolineales bacterium]|nr:hypothetical protein [Anaerolineales bacterium]